LIRENKIPQITSQMQIGTNQGMIVMEQAIKDLLSHGIISEEEARYYHTVSSETDESKRFDTSLGKMHLQPGDNEF
jgi:Tfp pilus assembly pilus retraction ATPase PilT